MESLPKWSVTDQPCSWAAQNKNRVDEMVAPKPLKEFCHFPVLQMKTSRSIHFNENEALRILLDGKCLRSVRLCFQRIHQKERDELFVIHRVSNVSVSKTHGGQKYERRTSCD